MQIQVFGAPSWMVVNVIYYREMILRGIAHRSTWPSTFFRTKSERPGILLVFHANCSLASHHIFCTFDCSNISSLSSKKLEQFLQRNISQYVQLNDNKYFH